MADNEVKMENAEIYRHDLLQPQQIYELNRALDIEKEIRDHLDPYSRFTESMFRRQALPILSGLLDGTFDSNVWTDCIGSGMVSLQVVDDVDNSKLLFQVPALYYTGQTLLHVEGQASLTDESLEISNYAEIMPSVGIRAKHDLIVGTLDGIDKVSYEDNRRRGKRTIDLLNWIFERYGLAGRIPYPAGMEDLLGEKPAAVAGKVNATAVAAAVPISSGGIEDGNEL